jgi:hypothetical protein
MVRYTVYSEHLTAFLFHDSSNVLIYFFLMGRSNQRLSLLDGKDELDDYLRVGIRHVLSLRVNLPFVDTGYKHRAPTGRGATRRRLLQTSRPHGARSNAAMAATNIAPLWGGSDPERVDRNRRRTSPTTIHSPSHIYSSTLDRPSPGVEIITAPSRTTLRPRGS